MPGGSKGTQSLRRMLIGYGNPDRGDDAAGLLVVRAVKGSVPAGVEVSEVMGDGFALMEAWAGCSTAVIVDAVVSGAAPGTVHRFDGRRLPGQEEMRLVSTHGIGLREALATAAPLGRLPSEIVVIGIEGQIFDPGAGLSREVSEAVPRAAALVLEVLGGSRP
jgi:hydrogenase maturation protease